MVNKPIAIELFCGSFGWSAGFAAEGFHCIGFDIEHLPHHGTVPENCELVIQDVLTIHGSQFKDAAILLCSPPCQKYSYLAMPWSRSVDIVRPCGDGWEVLNSAAAKEMRAEWEHEGPDNRLFEACFRIQREASAVGAICPWCHGTGTESVHLASGDRTHTCGICFGSGRAYRYIPLIVENVRGAIPWVGRSAWNYGSFHLWGDVPALMPVNFKRGSKVPGFRFDGSGRSFQTASVEATGTKGFGGGWFHNADSGSMNPSRNPREFLYAIESEGTKIGGDWFSDPKSTCRKHGSRSAARKAASAQIAKIPFPLSSHIARVYYPRENRKSA